MSRWIVKLVSLFLLGFALCCTFSLAIADDTEESQEQTLPDGSTETDYTDAAGGKVKQIKHPDGTTETDVTDTQGNETITTQHADGTVDVQNKTVKQ